MMNDIQLEHIRTLLRTHYGATEVFLDGHRLNVYGCDVDSAYTAVVVEYGDIYDVEYDKRNEQSKYCRLLITKKKL